MQRCRSRPKIHEQKPVTVFRIEKAQQERLRAKHRAIEGSLLSEYRVFPAQAKQIAMQRVGFGMSFALV